MAGIYKVEIQESLDDLKQLLRQQKVVSSKERIQLLYLLKSGAKIVEDAARLLGRHRVTLEQVVAALSGQRIRWVVREEQD